MPGRGLYRYSNKWSKESSGAEELEPSTFPSLLRELLPAPVLPELSPRWT